MKLYYKFIILVFLFTNLSLAQDKSNDAPKSIITINAFSPIVSYAPRWNLGYIRKIENRYWVGLELGYGNKDISINFAEDGGWIESSYKIFEIKPELYYDLRPKSKLKHLLSLELQYLNHFDQFENNWYYDIKDNNYYKFDLADYKRIKYGININYNLIYNITKNLALMQKVGVGYRKREVQYSSLVNKVEDEFFEEPDSFILPVGNGFLHDNGNLGGLNFNVDFKIIYKL